MRIIYNGDNSDISCDWRDAKLRPLNQTTNSSTKQQLCFDGGFKLHQATLKLITSWEHLSNKKDNLTKVEPPSQQRSPCGLQQPTIPPGFKQTILSFCRGCNNFDHMSSTYFNRRNLWSNLKGGRSPGGSTGVPLLMRITNLEEKYDIW